LDGVELRRREEEAGVGWFRKQGRGGGLLRAQEYPLPGDRAEAGGAPAGRLCRQFRISPCRTLDPLKVFGRLESKRRGCRGRQANDTMWRMQFRLRRTINP